MAIFGGDHKTRIGTGIATTIIVGHFTIQVVTEGVLQEFAAQTIPDIQPRAGGWNNALIELYPKKWFGPFPHSSIRDTRQGGDSKAVAVLN